MSDAGSGSQLAGVAPANVRGHSSAAMPAAAASPASHVLLRKRSAGGVLMVASVAPQRVLGSMQPAGAQPQQQQQQQAQAAVPTSQAAVPMEVQLPVQTPTSTAGARGARPLSRFGQEAGALSPGTPSPLTERPAAAGSGSALGQAPLAAVAPRGPDRQSGPHPGDGFSSSGGGGGSSGSPADSAVALQQPFSKLLVKPDR